ncbi:hypothetical protein F5Y01DRAFT_182386 [Xylaria sp. FL0043]|nr:hypothetical protein F5Y01DRAFT_182386 [Xylaria sp. FL0043]
MRAASLPKANPPARKSDTLSSDVPSPLHIIKRTKTVEFRPTEKRETSNGSIDYGPDRPLSVVKKRQSRGNIAKPPMLKRACISPAEEYPKPRAALRWLSRQRTSSTGTTRRRYNSRNSSMSSYESSIGRASGLGFINEASTMEPFESHGSTQMDLSSSNILRSPDYYDDCHILVPRISITPEIQASNTVMSTVWAAIEISAQLSLPCPNDILDSRRGDNRFLSNPLRLGSASRFGSLYDLQVDVLPVPQTTVVEVIQDHSKRNLSLGSSMLVLAKIQIDHRQRQRGRAMIQKSNELIADIENTLGASSVKYIQVHIQYHHSGFPASNYAEPTNGTIDWQTQLDTTVIGIIKAQELHSTSCSSSSGIGGSALFGLVASYWGPLRANEIFSGMPRRPDPIVTANNAALTRGQMLMATNDRLPYQCAVERGQFTPQPRKQIATKASSPDQGEDPARKIWTEMRRRISQGRPNMQRRNADNMPAVATPTIPGRTSMNTSSLRMKSDVDRRREMIRDVALRNKRSIGADSLKSLVPSMMNLDIGGREVWDDWSSDASNKENVPPERRRDARWSLAGWW